MNDKKKETGRAEEPLVFELSKRGRRGVEPPSPDVPETRPEDILPEEFLRSDIEGFPEVSEPQVVRHYTRLSEMNFGVDTGFYPLGSCTMKYNPKINEDVARLSGFSALHPYEPERFCQGALEIMYELEGFLQEISGMDAVTLQPSAGAQGELTGLLMVAACLKDRGERRTKIIIPDTAHGTNPASAMLAGFEVVTIKESGGIASVEAVKEVMDEDTAALMLTNPNTLGLFERNIKEIADIVHEKGGFVYCDGANLNALMGIMKLGDMGVDLVQFNLHKTFSTPHGGGGPGSGPVGVKNVLEPYLPKPRIVKDGDGSYRLDFERPRSIGRVKAFYGNFSVILKAYAYIRRLGPEGLRRASEVAILNANYIKERLKQEFHLPFDETCMHECVFSDKLQAPYGVTTLDVAKRLMDYGFHPPTIYFPLVVHGAIMIEPTETESPETLDRFIEAMKAIAQEARTSSELLKEAPHTTKIARVDEARAAKRPVLRWKG